MAGLFATRSIDGRKLDQWQYEVTGAGRIWYCPDPDRRITWLVLAARVTRRRPSDAPGCTGVLGPFVPSFVPRNAAAR
jgi:hypothetical protein